MSSKSFRSVASIFGLLLILVLALTVPAYAQGTGNQPQTCLTNGGAKGFVFAPNNWFTLCGQPAVFRFAYDGSGNGVKIELATNPGGAASFDVYNSGNFNQASGGTFTGSGATGWGNPIGSGTTDANANNDLTWTGGSSAGDNYFVVVTPTTNQPVQAWIAMTGQGGSGFTFMPGNANQGNAAGTGTTTAATTGTSTTATTTSGASTTAGTTSTNVGTATNSGAPSTLPQTGGEELLLPLLGAAAALLSAGAFARRRGH